jgi:hypothetical protein
MFHEYLAKRHCQDNLQFYEAVIYWKAQNPADPSRARNAKLIIENVSYKDT